MAVVIVGVVVVVAVLNDDRGVPLATLIFLGILLVMDFVTRRTAFGRHIYAVGGNAEAARRAGISLDPGPPDRLRAVLHPRGDRRDHGGVAAVRRQPGARAAATSS